jgi:periplasmic protein TonB
MAVPNRLTGSLPVSIAVHLAVLVLMVVIPLTAEVALPVPATAIDTYMRAVPEPPPPPLPVERSNAQRMTEPRRPSATAPPAITPEREVARSRPDAPGGVDLGLPLSGAPFADLGRTPPKLPPPLAPAPVKLSGPVRPGTLVQSPRKIVDVRPLYPDIAREARVQGTVVLEAVLDRGGRVSQLRILESVPLLDAAAIAAVRQWQYTPSTLHGIPVEVLMTITVTFTLQE